MPDKDHTRSSLNTYLSHCVPGIVPDLEDTGLTPDRWGPCITEFMPSRELHF